MSFSGVRFDLICFVFVFLLSLKPQPFVQSFFVDMNAPRQPHAVTLQLPASFSFLVLPFFVSEVFLCHYRFLFVESMSYVFFSLVTTG